MMFQITKGRAGRRRAALWIAGLLSTAFAFAGTGHSAAVGSVAPAPAATTLAAPHQPKDPASVRQVPLAEVMGQPNTAVKVPGAKVRVGKGRNVVDPGRTVEKPVRVESTSKLKASPRSAFSDVFTSPTAPGGGCRLEYGTPGQCLPRVPPSQAAHAEHGMKPSEKWSCKEVRGLFRTGLAVRTAGTDPLGLDTNRDGTACGSGDQ